MSRVLNMVFGRKGLENSARNILNSYSYFNRKFYLEETIIPTMHFQDSLPKLPIPSLEHTQKRFEYFAEPMALTPEAFENTKKRSASFFKGPAKKLQEELVKRDKSKYSSFIAEPWYDMYLRARDPLVINSNPQLTFNDLEDLSRMDQASRATDLIYSSLRFYRTLKDNKLSPDIFHTKPKKSNSESFKRLMSLIPKPFAFYGAYFYGAFPLDMSQYSNLFSSTRIPHLEKDEIVAFEEEESRHIVIQRGSQFFKVNVLDEHGALIDKQHLRSAIENILSKSEVFEDPLGILTTLNRDEWARARSELLESPNNAENLKKIDSSLFIVCLDDNSFETYEEIAAGMLHGNARNRWFDKSFQLIVARNGKAAVNFEHAWGDGVAVLRYFNSVFDDVAKQEKTGESTFKSDSNVEELQFDLSENLKATIEKGGKEVDALISSVETATLESDLISKKFCKEKKIGADGCLQMCFQLGHYIMNGTIKATYESASTAGFKHGRTETIRSATPEAKIMAQTMLSTDATDEQKKEALLKAISNHGRITKDALLGKGIDRHLFALKVVAEQENLYKDEVSAFFEDETMSEMNYYILSTSTLSSPALFAGGFGPVNPDCYGLAYGINKDAFRTAVTSFQKDSRNMRDCILEAADRINKLLQQ